MRSVDLIYQYLKEYSKETVEQFDDLMDQVMDQAEQGNIFADGQYVDTFGIVDFEDYNYIEAYGENLYRAVDGATFKDSTASVNQGYLETSNINVVSEMVDMINIAREFESNQKIVNSIDEMLGKMVSISEL